MLVERVGGLAVLVSAFVVACSSGTTLGGGDGGTSSGMSSGTILAKPRVTFDSTIAPGTHTQVQCPRTGTWLTIGSFGNPAAGRVDPNDPTTPLQEPVRPVEDGGSDHGGTVAVSCSVKQAGAGFDVAAHAELTGAPGGAVTVTGSFKPSGDSAGITLVLTKKGETFTATDCVAQFDATLGQAVAGGRVWATVTCVNAAQASAAQNCTTQAQLRFENCTE